MKSAARRAFELMKSKFVKLMKTLIYALRKKIAINEIDLQTIKTCLSLKDPDHEKQFNDAQTVDDLLKMIRSDCFFTNPDPLESLVVMFDLHEEEQKVEQYRHDLEKYYQEVLTEDFIQQGVEEYDKDANIEVSIAFFIVEIFLDGVVSLRTQLRMYTEYKNVPVHS